MCVECAALDSLLLVMKLLDSDPSLGSGFHGSGELQGDKLLLSEQKMERLALLLFFLLLLLFLLLHQPSRDDETGHHSSTCYWCSRAGQRVQGSTCPSLPQELLVLVGQRGG